MSSGSQFSMGDIYSRQGRSRPIARALVGLLLNVAAAWLLAILLSDPALQPFALLGFVILLALLIATLGYAVAFVGAVLNALVFEYVLFGHKQVYWGIVQLIQGALGRWF